MGKRELVALLSLSFWCIVVVVWHFLVVPWNCLQFVIVVLPDHTHLLFLFYFIGRRMHLYMYNVFVWFIFKAVQQDKTYSSATVTLFVTVIDVDDNLPVFDPVNYTVNMLEHSPDGSYITQVKAKDNDLVNITLCRLSNSLYTQQKRNAQL